MDIDALKSASQTVDEPVWVGEDVHGLPGVELQIIAMGAKEMRRKINRRMRALREEYLGDDGVPRDDVQDIADDEIQLAQLADWKGFTSDGKDVPYSAETAQVMAGVSLFWTALTLSVQHVNKLAGDAAERLEKN